MNVRRPDEWIGPYRIRTEIGGGEYGSVYVVERQGVERFLQLFAAKLLRPQYTQFKDRFSVEARLASLLDHQNIVPTYEYFLDETRNQYCIIMGFVDGINLERLIFHSNVRIPLDVVVYVLLEVLEGLDYAHSREYQGEPMNLVHRDIKPPNILLSREGEVRITDWGVARADVWWRQRTQALSPKGTPAYMAPEQFIRDPRTDRLEVDARTDLYGAALVSVELLTRRVAFDAPTLQALNKKIQEGDPERLKKLKKVAPTALAKVIERACSRDKEERQSSARELIGQVTKAFPVNPYAARKQLAEIVAMVAGPPSAALLRATFAGFSARRTEPLADESPAAAEVQARTEAASLERWQQTTAKTEHESTADLEPPPTTPRSLRMTVPDSSPPREDAAPASLIDDDKTAPTAMARMQQGPPVAPALTSMVIDGSGAFRATLPADGMEGEPIPERRRSFARAGEIKVRSGKDVGPLVAEPRRRRSNLTLPLVGAVAAGLMTWGWVGIRYFRSTPAGGTFAVRAETRESVAPSHVADDVIVPLLSVTTAPQEAAPIPLVGTEPSAVAASRPQPPVVAPTTVAAISEPTRRPKKHRPSPYRAVTGDNYGYLSVKQGTAWDSAWRLKVDISVVAMPLADYALPAGEHVVQVVRKDVSRPVEEKRIVIVANKHTRVVLP